MATSPSAESFPAIEPLGDHAIVVTLGDDIDAATTASVRLLTERLRETTVDGVMDVVPAYASVGIYFDPSKTSHASMTQVVRDLLTRAASSGTDIGRLVEIPVSYGGEHGPDLMEVAAGAGLTAEEVVAIHSSTEYVVHMIGFMPGFPYLGGLDERLVTPRRTTPRTRVPAGSVAIGGKQTGIYPSTSPGGWNIIGRTSVRMFDVDKNPPSLLQPGDRVRFVGAPASGIDAEMRG